MITWLKNKLSLLPGHNISTSWASSLDEKRIGRLVLFTFSFLLLLRFVFAGVMGLMPQDAYYYFYSQHLALSYYDHPPAIAYLLRFFTSLFGDKVIVIKLANTITTLFTVFAFYHLASRFLSGHKKQVAVLLFFSSFLITILSLVVTPDIPLLLFWTLSLLALHNALFLDKKIYWIWAGIAMGLSFDSKYTGLLLVIGLFLFLIFSGKHRKLFFSVWFWLCILFFAITISPVIIWNIQYDFASLGFQSAERLQSMSGFKIHLEFLPGVLVHQAAILLPVLFISLIIVLYKTFRKYGLRIQKISADKLFLLAFFLPGFLGFLAVSPIYWVKVNWIMPAYITGIIWVSIYFKIKWLRIQLIISLIVHIVMAAEIIFYLVPVKSEDTWYGWGELARQVKKIKKSNPDDFIFSSGSYKTAAILDFYLKERVYAANVVGTNALQFSIVDTDLNLLKGKNAILINYNSDILAETQQKELPPFILSFFDEVTQMEFISIKKYSKIVRQFSVYKCRNYHGNGQ